MFKLYAISSMCFFLMQLSRCIAAVPCHATYAESDWAYYNGDLASTHYSCLKDIDTNNVRRLTLKWVYDTTESAYDAEQGLLGDMEVNPLAIDGQLYLVSQNGRLISLDGATGRERWTFDPRSRKNEKKISRGPRGVSYWSDGTSHRVFFTYESDLYAIDANSGQPVSEFGSSGRVSLKSGLGRDLASLSIESRSPGLVYNNLIIMGSNGHAPGDIRAFDVRTGQLKWTFHTIPHPGEFGYETWPKDAWKTVIGANSWPGMALDRKRGIVFVPLADPQDFYGKNRTGDNLFANSLVALNANSGRRLWHFQAIRHDLWDRDLPAPPTLVTISRHGKHIDAVAQLSKQGFVYVLDRITGTSLFPLVERATYPSDIPGENAARTQIEPILPAPFARQDLSVDRLSKRTPQANAAVVAQFKELRSRGLWDPPSEQGTILFPGLAGGGLWGGAAYDPTSGLLYVNSTEDAWILRMKRISGRSTTGALYRELCSGCHGIDRAGKPAAAPSLIGIQNRVTNEAIKGKIAKGGERMPSFGVQLSTDEIALLANYLTTGVEGSLGSGANDETVPGKQSDTYVFEGAERLLDPEGYPGIEPPWGTLNAIDLNTGTYAWKIPFGEFPELAQQGLKTTGSENYGGPIVTAGGLLFIAATAFDNKFRAFDKHTGKMLWETDLPAAGIATPTTYRANGRQFVVIAAGGGKNPKLPSGSKVVAFALRQ